MEKQLLIDGISFVQITPQQLTESLEKNNGRLFIDGVLQRADAINQNGRKYPKDVLLRESEKYANVFIKENRALGELDHPDSSIVNLANTSHNIVKLWWEGNDLKGKIEILDTPSGNIAKSLLKAGIRLGISSRGLGSVKTLGEGTVEVQDDFEIVCWDLVSNPSTQGAFMEVVKESIEYKQANKYAKINSIITDILTTIQ